MKRNPRALAHTRGLRLRLANPPHQLTVAEQLMAGPEGREEGLGSSFGR